MIRSNHLYIFWGRGCTFTPYKTFSGYDFHISDRCWQWPCQTVKSGIFSTPERTSTDEKNGTPAICVQYNRPPWRNREKNSARWALIVHSLSISIRIKITSEDEESMNEKFSISHFQRSTRKKDLEKGLYLLRLKRHPAKRSDTMKSGSVALQESG